MHEDFLNILNLISYFIHILLKFFPYLNNHEFWNLMQEQYHLFQKFLFKVFLFQYKFIQFN